MTRKCSLCGAYHPKGMGERVGGDGFMADIRIVVCEGIPDGHMGMWSEDGSVVLIAADGTLVYPETLAQ